VRYKQIDVFRSQSRALQNVARYLGHRTNCHFEEFITLHLEEMITGRDRFRCWPTTRSTARREELFLVSAIRPNLGPQNASVFLYWTKYSGACAISEQDARLSISVVDILQSGFQLQ
jgi:hypothetical protein